MRPTAACRAVLLISLFSTLGNGQRLVESRFTRFVCPDYPRMAQLAKVHGPVVLDLIVDRNGVPEEIRVVRGHPMLIMAAMEAAKQWRFKRYLLNKTAVEVSTRIQLNFILAGGDPRHRCSIERPQPQTRQRNSDKIY